MEQTINDAWWASHFRPGKEGSADYVSNDGRLLIELKAESHGVQSLQAALMRLAAQLRVNPPHTRAGLVFQRGRMSQSRLLKEWDASRQVLRPELAKRLFLIVLDNGNSWASQHDPEIEQVTRALTSALRQDVRSSDSLRPHTGHKYYEVLKVLLLHWLREEGPQPIGKIADEVGCTYPTVREAFNRPVIANYLQRHSNREIELKAFPLRAWQELVALAATHRQTIAYFDSSGDRPAYRDLQRRIQRLDQENLAWGGVVAARYWDKSFDLHGVPRLDVTIHTNEGYANTAFVQKIDPALKPAASSDSAALVVHPLFRSRSFFEQSKRKERFCDPIETALDLYELGLTTQAFQLLRQFRPDLRL